MRLLALEECNARSGHLSLHTFSGTDIPEYAILSHRWTDDEVLFKDVENGTSASRNGHAKLCGAIEQARADGFAFLWDDTCCIDKSSSAELSEAINSMWAWYRDSSICYAYLDDVSSKVEDADFESEFKASAWFTRGWTLQELIAPTQVNFYNKSWAFVGTRKVLQRAISEVTGIDDEFLNHTRPLSTVSVAKRMSWAAHRKTSRSEDIAYCLMGLFSVNMPMLYGEGSRAFQRLQEEILRNSDDESIFAWLDERAKAEDIHGLLADGPFYFKDAGNIGPMLDLHEATRRPWRTTNLGLNIQRAPSPMSGQMPLFCGRLGQPGYLTVMIKSVADRSVRCNLAEIRNSMHISQEGNLYFPQEVPHVERFLPMSIIRYQLRMSPDMHGTWSQDYQRTRLHPLNSSADKDHDPSGIHAVSKYGTYADLATQFTCLANNIQVSIIIGIMNGSDLGFHASNGRITFMDRDDGDYVMTTIPNMNIVFSATALPIGSSVFVGGLHCVSVRRSRRSSPGGILGDNDEMEGLEVDITPLANHRSPETSCCCIL